MKGKVKPTLTPEQWYYVCESFSKWIDAKIAGDVNLKGFVYSLSDIEAQAVMRVLNQLKPDLWHSALMWRMLVEGKDPLPNRPNLQHSYPDYGD